MKQVRYKNEQDQLPGFVNALNSNPLFWIPRLGTIFANTIA